MKMRRFRKALFGFFEKEIQKQVGYELLGKVYTQDRLEMVQLNFDIVLRDSPNAMNAPPSYEYERALEMAKQKLFEEAMKHMVFDTQSMINPNFSDERVMRATLFIGKSNA
jgi:hypothetical protein